MWLKLKPRLTTKKNKSWLGAMLAAATIAGLVIAAENASLFQLLEWATLDQFFRWRPQEPPDPRIAIVTIDESDIAKMAQWPMPDGVLAKLVLNLKAYNPRVIGLDLYRDLPVEPGHDALVEVFQSAPNLIGIEKAIGNTVPPPPTLEALEQVAMADVLLDADGKVRRALITAKPKDGKQKLSLGARVALMYLEAEGITPEAIDKTKTRLGRATFVPFTGNDGGYARTNAGGYQILLNFRGLLDRFSSISMTEVLENKIAPELIRDRIVLIGATAESLNDFFYTPHSTRLIGSPKRTPGVAIHANSISQILSGALEGRPFIRVWAEPLEWLWTLSWSLLGASATCLLVKSKGANKWICSQTTAATILIVLLGSVQIATSYLVFLAGWWLPVVSPVLALTGSGMAIAIYYSLSKERQSILAFKDIAERKKRYEAERLQLNNELLQLNRAYERFVPSQFLQILDKPSIVELQLGEAVAKEMSILFSDIRHFTSISENMLPEENFQFINSYLSAMEPAILENNGFIDKYIGDGIMALFGGSADDAVRAAISMLERLQEYNTAKLTPHRIPIKIGIGINTGNLMLGTVGGEQRMNGTAIGDAVNLASRIESMTKNYGISLLISHQTFSSLENPLNYEIRLIDRVKVKGKSELVSVFEVFSADPPLVRRGKRETVGIFEQAVLQYNLGAYREAAQLFQYCLQVNSGDGVAGIYLERCQQQGSDRMVVD